MQRNHIECFPTVKNLIKDLKSTKTIPVALGNAQTMQVLLRLIELREDRNHFQQELSAIDLDRLAQLQVLANFLGNEQIADRALAEIEKRLCNDESMDALLNYPVRLKSILDSVRSNLMPDALERVQGGICHVGMLADSMCRHVFSKINCTNASCVDFNESIRRLVSGHRDGSIRIWDANSKDCLCELSETNQGSVCSVRFNKSGDKVVSVLFHSQPSVCVWGVEFGGCFNRLHLRSNLPDIPTVAFFMQDENTIAIALYNGCWAIWNLSNGTVTTRPKSDSSQILFNVHGLMEAIAVEGNISLIFNDHQTNFRCISPIRSCDSIRHAEYRAGRITTVNEDGSICLWGINQVNRSITLEQIMFLIYLCKLRNQKAVLNLFDRPWLIKIFESLPEELKSDFASLITEQPGQQNQGQVQQRSWLSSLVNRQSLSVVLPALAAGGFCVYRYLRK